MSTSDFNALGNAITECPQAGLKADNPKPIRQLAQDQIEKLSSQGSNIRVNQDYSCFPQDETAIDINPTTKKNLLGGANDYRLGWGTSGFYASTDNGNHWYDGIIPFPSLPSGDNLTAVAILPLFTTGRVSRTTRTSTSTAPTTPVESG